MSSNGTLLLVWLDSHPRVPRLKESRLRGGRFARNTPDVMHHDPAASLIQFLFALWTPLHMVENP